MALSDKARKGLRLALVSKELGDEVSDAIDSGANDQAADVAALGALASVGTTDGSGGAGDAALATDVDSNFSDVQSKIDEILTSLKNAGIMA